MQTRLSELVPRPRAIGPVFLDPDIGWVVSRHASVTAVLSDSRYAVPAADRCGPPGTLAWLRGMVCRFSEGAAHDRRRAIAQDELTRANPAALQREAHRRTHRILDRADGAPVCFRSLLRPLAGCWQCDCSPSARAGRSPVDVMASLARDVPIRVLGRALGVTDLRTLTEAVPVASADYLSPGEQPAAADAAVAVLADLLGPGRDELVASRIALLMQAYEATAGLIGGALAIALRTADPERWPPTSIIAETLRFDPPVRTMRRVTVADVELCGQVLATGTDVVLDVAAANRDPAVFVNPDRFDPARGEPPHLTFGTGRRPCPGTAHAIHLAAGVVDAIVQRCRLTSTDAGMEVVVR